MLRYAAIDIGSNAVRLLIADILINDKELIARKNTLLRVPLRLGDEAFIDGEISQGKAEKMVKTCRAFKELMEVYNVKDYFACATSAMRDASNGPAIVNACQKEGVDINIIDGGREARIIYSSHLHQVLNPKRVYLYIDVGGGSTEVSIFAKGKFVESKSFNLGTIRILDNQDSPETWEALGDWVKEHTASYKQVYGIGTGGNINKLSRLINSGTDKPFSYEKLLTIYHHLEKYSLKERILKLGLREDRADVIIPATEIFLHIMKQANLKNVFTPRVGLVDGIIQTLMDKHKENILS